jgi:2'-hydroxyisoflavone reductase
VRLLILGGTVFLGRAVVADAVARGHDVTIFHRGTHPAPAGVTELRGDRSTGDLAALRTGSWDAVVDTSGYVPRIVGEAAALLAPRVGHYCFISSVSVYAPQPGPIDETSTVATLDDPTVEDLGEGRYGALKALCETAAADATGGRATGVRAGLIVGPHDPTGRFTYWPHRFARGGEVLVFDRPERTVQLIDVRDLAAWIVGACEAQVTGPVNVTGTWTMGALADACLAAAPAGTEAVWVSDERLVAHDVGEWMELPLWIAPGSDEAAALTEVRTDRAVATGLTLRPLAETVEGTLALAAPVDGVGLAPERERAVLDAGT